MSVPESINERVLREIREDNEFEWRTHLAETFERFPLIIPSTTPLPRITLKHAQDACNKSFAIYWTPPGDQIFPDIFDALYLPWSHGNIHKIDIAFERFLAKLIRVGEADPSSPSLRCGTVLEHTKPTMDQILNVHSALCHQVQDAKDRQFFLNHPDREDDPDSGYITSLGLIGIMGTDNPTQHEFYNIKPLFRALILVIDEQENAFYRVRNPLMQKVHLILTGETAGLSEKITFENIGDEIIGGDVNSDRVTTFLPAAVRFIIDLEARESAAFPDTKDPRVLEMNDLRGLTYENFMKEARRDGWTGGDIVGPTTQWCKSQGKPGRLVKWDQPPRDRY